MQFINQHILSIAIYSFAMAFVWIEVVKAPILKFKPFNCLPCLSGWLSLLFYHHIDLFTIPVMCFSQVFAIIFYSLIKKHL
jgi:hypothetical protein